HSGRRHLQRGLQPALLRGAGLLAGQAGGVRRQGGQRREIGPANRGVSRPCSLSSSFELFRSWVPAGARAVRAMSALTEHERGWRKSAFTRRSTAGSRFSLRKSAKVELSTGPRKSVTTTPLIPSVAKRSRGTSV